MAINVRAGVAAHLGSGHEAGGALADIMEVSAEALGDLRATLSLLRDVDEPAPTAPTLDLKSLTQLVDRVEAGGLAADVEAELLAAVRHVAEGESLLAPSVTKRLIEAYIAQPEQTAVLPDGLSELTPREHEVLGLVGRGLNNGEIAAALHLSPLTAKTHVSRILMKLGARDRVQLVVMAYRAGIVAP